MNPPGTRPLKTMKEDSSSVILLPKSTAESKAVVQPAAPVQTASEATAFRYDIGFPDEPLLVV